MKAKTIKANEELVYWIWELLEGLNSHRPYVPADFKNECFIPDF